MTQLASDTFDRGDNADLGANWTVQVAAFKIVSNTAAPASTAADSNEVESTVLPDDQYSEIVFAATAANGLGTGCGPTCRNPNPALWTHYRLVGNLSGWRLIRFNTGVPTTLDSGASPTFTAGDTLRLEVSTSGANCAWRVLKNSVEFSSGTDTSPIASGKAGITYSETDAGTTIASWAAGDLETIIYTDAPETLRIVRSSLRLR